MLPKKRFGQNFLKDKQILSELTNCLKILPQDKFLEIGPGKGDFTENILNLCGNYHGIEIDKDLFKFLESKFKTKNSIFHNEDILKFEAEKLFNKSKFRVVGNIPYNISSPLLEWCEKRYEMISDMHFMLQKEFALRCSGNENTSSYGRLSVICNYLYDMEILKEVDKSFFSPEPKVDSLFVRFTPKKNTYLPRELSNLKKITRTLFNKKRKKISNSLSDIFDKKSLKNLEININLDLRPDELSLDKYLQLASQLEENA